ncbi:GTP cyclohydrolase I FolE2 [bacterium]|nr:GTP cyclohydrolase I FolE2 [bacterium]
MIDIQSTPDPRHISIDRVGIKDLRYPIKVRLPHGGYQQTIAEIDVFVDLHPKFRGTHMSRFVEIIDRISGQELTLFTLPDILTQVREQLGSKTSELYIRFPYFLRKKAPVSEIAGMVDYQCRFHGRLDGEMVFTYGVTAPVTSLCPCSREISEAGAHNQRGEVSVDIRSVDKEIIWFEELIETVESCVSAPVFSILKREDEKYVTELAYKNPVFVEDIVRSLAEKFSNDERIVWFRVQAKSHESIHNHNAFAVIERDKTG